MLKRPFAAGICLLITHAIFAQNPIVPPGVYIADPSARVWEDGKLYVYGSVDESTDYYCSWTYHVLSSSDLRGWSIHENRFASRGPGDQVPESDQLLFAPDCQFSNGVYYLYYCLPDNDYTEGVATSRHPAGPFINGKNIRLHGHQQIDPTVFIDDDGQAYYIWGQFTAKMAKLKSNMREIDEATLKDDVLTEKEHYFHEGGTMIKRRGIYYFIYAHMGRSDMPTCIGYATSRFPMGPYRYGGVIIDNDRCDPGNWNNHGSVVQFNGQYYVFYHRSTHGSRMMRKACVEPITFNDDGSINEVEMTSQGAGDPLNAHAPIDAERACLLFGNVRIQAFAPDNEELGQIADGDRVAYKYVDFGRGVDGVKFRIKSGSQSGTIQLAIDRPWSSSIATVYIPDTKEEWCEVSADVSRVNGVHALWLRFHGEGSDLFSIDWLEFQ